MPGLSSYQRRERDELLIHEVNEADGQPFLALKYVAGGIRRWMGVWVSGFQSKCERRGESGATGGTIIVRRKRSETLVQAAGPAPADSVTERKPRREFGPNLTAVFSNREAARMLLLISAMRGNGFSL
jgi:hypothetical protein